MPFNFFRMEQLNMSNKYNYYLYVATKQGWLGQNLGIVSHPTPVPV